jgi:4-hydroxy-tetrahydrodipicolinate synthase
MPIDVVVPDASWSWDAALRGVVPPLISPLRTTGDVDEVSVQLLVDHVLAGGCTGLFVLGGCGEGAWMTNTQRAAVVRTVVRATAGRAPVLAGVMLAATGPALDAARQAESEGADALVVGSPYYGEADAGMQERHVEAILDAVPLPVLLYNIPQATHNPLAPTTVARLAVHPRILGIKDSAGNLHTFQEFLNVKSQRASFRVLQGNEPVASSSLLLGADGLVPGMANFAPSLFVALHRAASLGDADTCGTIQAAITDLWTLHTHGHWLTALKGACSILGFGNGLPASPLLPASNAERAAIHAILERNQVAPPTAAAD